MLISIPDNTGEYITKIYENSEDVHRFINIAYEKIKETFIKDKMPKYAIVITQCPGKCLSEYHSKKCKVYRFSFNVYLPSPVEDYCGSIDITSDEDVVFFEVNKNDMFDDFTEEDVFAYAHESGDTIATVNENTLKFNDESVKKSVIKNLKNLYIKE